MLWSKRPITTASAPVSGASAPTYTNDVWPPVRSVSVAQNNRRPCCSPMSYPSTSPRTAWPDGAERWDNWMAAQHLPRDLVRPNCSFNNSFKRKKIPFLVNRTFNETPTERLQEQWVSWVHILKMKILRWFVILRYFLMWGCECHIIFIKRCQLQKTLDRTNSSKLVQCQSLAMLQRVLCLWLPIAVVYFHV